jgi:hypothetical protein
VSIIHVFWGWAWEWGENGLGVNLGAGMGERLLTITRYCAVLVVFMGNMPD